MNLKIIIGILLLSFVSFGQDSKLELNYDRSVEFAEVPLECIYKEYPNKLNQVLTDSTHLQSPKELHPIFYGCFDWHSSVHGHWLLAKLMNNNPGTELEKQVSKVFDFQFQVSKVQQELAYFQPSLNKSFERTYGWAWILKLYAELYKSPLNSEHKWTNNLQSLIDQITSFYKEFLPKLVYPVRVGEHTNTAFGLSLALDYSRVVGDEDLENLILSRSKEFFANDQGCPLNWEPSGFDFISPCLQEAELMSKVYSKKDFENWLGEYLPQLLNKDFTLEPGRVIDRTDGKLVHLDGLNFSRAWCLYQIADVLGKKGEHLVKLADTHVLSSADQVINSNYMGSHWLASFYVKALESRENSMK
ncbi:MAG: DUF2891 domain-containing protein [Crocinitomicaceae bacterium]|nr:DUF2891 domain-containing protein [Crocinitomicaceae bacterium]